MKACVCGHKRYWHSYYKNDNTKCMFMECECNKYVECGGDCNGVI